PPPPPGVRGRRLSRSARRHRSRRELCPSRARLCRRGGSRSSFGGEGWGEQTDFSHDLGSRAVGRFLVIFPFITTPRVISHLEASQFSFARKSSWLSPLPSFLFSP